MKKLLGVLGRCVVRNKN